MAAVGLPRLLLVDVELNAVPDVDENEDWVRLPVVSADLAARVDTLRDRTSSVSLDGPVLRTARGSVMLSPAETVVTLELMVTATTVVARPALERRLRLHVEVTPRTLDDVVYRLRRRLRPLGLDLFVARGRGFSLDARPDWPIDEAVVLT
jgi:DNA-binding response OmpR family regulator